MAITATRFKMLDSETNVAVSDFSNPQTSSIFNSPNLELKAMDTDMSGFLKQGIADGSISLTPTADTANSALRKTKDAFSSLKSVQSLSSKSLDNYVAGMFPNSPQAASAYKQLASSCRTGPMGRYNSGKPFDFNINCNGSNNKSSGGCTSGFSNVLNKLTGGAYNSLFSDLNQSLSNLVALATTGFNANMCGVFSALTGGLDTKVITRGAGMLLGSLGSSGNLLGVFDLAKSTAGMADVAGNVLKEIPSGISNVFNNFQKPDMPETAFSGLNQSINMSMDNFDTNWNKSSLDGIASCSFIDKPSTDYAGIMRGDAMNFDVDEDNLDAIPGSDVNLMRAGVTSKASSFSSSSLDSLLA